MGQQNGKNITPESIDIKNINRFTNIPFKNTLVYSYKLLPPVWKETKVYAITRALQVKTNKIIVLKKMSKNVYNDFYFKREVLILKKLDHCNIVTIYEYFQTKTHYYITYNYFDGLSLIDYFIKYSKKITLKETKFIMTEIIQTLGYLHKFGILLRNFDPRNILYNGKNILFISFGYATLDGNKNFQKKDDKIFNSDTSIFCMSPETINHSYDRRADIWVIGVIFHLLLTGKLPFESNDKNELSIKIQYDAFDDRHLKASKCDYQLIELIHSMLNKNPKKRPKIKHILKNEWFKISEEDEKTQTGNEILSNLTVMGSKMNFIDGFRMIILNKIFINDELSDLRALFDMADANNDGVVTKSELKALFEKKNLIITEKQINAIFKKYDTNKTKSLEFREFSSAFTDLKNLTNSEHINEFFDFINEEDNLTINLAYFESKINYVLKDQERKVFEENTEGDGEITRKGFHNFIISLATTYQEHGSRRIMK